MRQQEEDKAAREQQLLMACIERELAERACKDWEEQRDCCHQDFIMMMMMVTGSKPASVSRSSPSS
eukprot:7312866-Ditylum_brightwellii.AAC.1